MVELALHPLCTTFPRMPGEEFAALKLDIKEHGLIDPIYLYEGKILDGRHRFYACQETGVEPRFREYEGSDPRGFVISVNLKRRHLNESQRAMVAASLANMRQGARTDIQPSANLQEVSQTEAADMLQVSPREITKAHCQQA